MKILSVLDDSEIKDKQLNAEWFALGAGDQTGIEGKILYPLFNQTGDTINLAVGTYVYLISATIAVTSSNVSATCGISLSNPTNTGVGTYNFTGTSVITRTGTPSFRIFNNASTKNIATLTTISRSVSRSYTIKGEGIISVTKEGTFTPSYAFSDTLLKGKVKLSDTNYIIIRRLSRSMNTLTDIFN